MQMKVIFPGRKKLSEKNLIRLDITNMWSLNYLKTRYIFSHLFYGLQNYLIKRNLT
jgi:hypothetical protein